MTATAVHQFQVTAAPLSQSHPPPPPPPPSHSLLRPPLESQNCSTQQSKVSSPRPSSAPSRQVRKQYMAVRHGHWNSWLFSKYEIQNPPSVAAKEKTHAEDLDLRFRACKFIAHMGVKLAVDGTPVSAACICLAQLYLSRFYMRSTWSSCAWRPLAMGALFAAAKVTDHRHRAKSIARAGYHVGLDHFDPRGQYGRELDPRNPLYEVLCDDVVKHELHLCAILCWDLSDLNTHAHARECVTLLGGSDAARRVANALVNDAYRTMVPLEYPDRVIGAAAASLAFKIAGETPRCRNEEGTLNLTQSSESLSWWSSYDEPEDIRDAVLQMLDLYQAHVKLSTVPPIAQANPLCSPPNTSPYPNASPSLITNATSVQRKSPQQPPPPPTTAAVNAKGMLVAPPANETSVMTPSTPAVFVADRKRSRNKSDDDADLEEGEVEEEAHELTKRMRST
ncbi:cyclin-like protein [Cladochytrium replicatum]|nr:cyclin-like protein [Cladochytrium replicatum]